MEAYSQSEALPGAGGEGGVALSGAAIDAERRIPLSTVLVWVLIGVALGAFWREAFHLVRAFLT